MYTTDISHLTDLLPDLRRIEVGEVVIFLPHNFDATKFVEHLDPLSRNNYNFDVRIVRTDIAELYFTVGARIVSIINPHREAFAVGTIEKHTFTSLKEVVSDTLCYLKDRITDPEDKQIITKVNHRDLIIHASAMDFGADPEDAYEDNLDREQKECLDAIRKLVLEYASRFKALPPLDAIRKTVVDKLVIDNGGFSTIEVTRDYKIILPQFNNTEIKMSPLAKAVYILFLCHPEGIRLKDIADYRNQLRKIYSLIKPGSDLVIADSHIDEIAIAGSESLQQKLSMTRYAVKRTFLSPELAERYMIKGTPGEPYAIGIPADMINLYTTLKHQLPE